MKINLINLIKYIMKRFLHALIGYSIIYRNKGNFKCVYANVLNPMLYIYWLIVIPISIFMHGISNTIDTLKKEWMTGYRYLKTRKK